MRPAFSSPRQAVAFALLLGALLALPVLVARTGWLRRSDVYPAMTWRMGISPLIQPKIFDETNGVDIAFLGSSHIWDGVNTPYVQRRLSEQLGREAEVFTLGWSWPGYDALYTFARDLLEHRHVRMLVIYDEHGPDEAPHRYSFRWFRAGEDFAALPGLTAARQASLYGGTVLGMPRHLLSLVRPNRLDDPGHGTNFMSSLFNAPNVVEQRGAMRARLGFGHRPPFVPYEPALVATPADAVIYSEQTRGLFSFTGPRATPYQLHFARKLAGLCEAHGTRLVALHLPELRESAMSVIPERERWDKFMGAPVDLVGIPGAKLFAGIPAAELPKLFLDAGHLNQNGQDVFTPIITPVLLQLYAATNRF
ncbi:MAG: hypothetical protein HY301_02695 [Verrucomicrobia bacterium]|nr:hypothetical protein [Verrucomicrobiota bacterium]